MSDSLRWSKKTLRTNVGPLIGGHSRPSVLMAHPLQVFSQMFSTWSTSRTDKWRKHSKVEKTSKLCFCSELLTKAEWIWNIRFILAGICSLQMEPTMANHNFITCRRRCLITISVSFKKASMRWRGELNNWMYKTLSKNYNDWASLTFSPNQALVSRNGIPYLGSSATTIAAIAAIPTTYLLVACWASHFSASSWPLPVETTMSSASASQHQPQDWHQPQRHPEKLQLIQLSRKIRDAVDVLMSFSKNRKGLVAHKHTLHILHSTLLLSHSLKEAWWNLCWLQITRSLKWIYQFQIWSFMRSFVCQKYSIFPTLQLSLSLSACFEIWSFQRAMFWKDSWINPCVRKTFG